jgi:hypothetical protein
MEYTKKSADSSCILETVALATLEKKCIMKEDKIGGYRHDHKRLPEKIPSDDFPELFQKSQRIVCN